MTTDMSKKELRRRIREEGAPAAYAALMRVLADPKATSTSLAAAARTMMDLTGYMKDADAPPKEPHEMTRFELDQSIIEGLEERTRNLDAREASLRDFEDYLNRAYAEIQGLTDEGVFG